MVLLFHSDMGGGRSEKKSNAWRSHCARVLGLLCLMPMTAGAAAGVERTAPAAIAAPDVVALRDAKPLGLLPESRLQALRRWRHTNPVEGMWDELRARCDRQWMKIATNPYRDWEEKTSQGGVGLRGRSLGTAVLELAMLAALENDRRYADQASAILLAATQQTDPAALAASDSDLMAGDAAHAFAVGLDWLWPWLDAAQRETLWREVRDYGEWIYRNSLVKPWGAENYSREAWNWNGVLHGSLGLCALWTGNADWLRRAEERSVAHLHTALDPSGLPWEGFTYACYGNLDVFPFLEALKLRTGRDRLGDDEGLKAFLENFRTLWIPGLAENVPWNQSSPIPVPIGMYWNLLARYRSPEAAWWWQRVYGARAAGGSFGAAIASQGASLPYCLLWCDPTIPAHAPGSEELFRRFDSGLVVARSGWGDDDSLVVFSAIRGIPNSWHHADQGSFSFYYRGEGFAVDAGAGFKPGLQHNTLLFDGVAQDAAGGPEHDPVDLTLCENRAGALTLSSDLTAAYRKRAGLDSYTRQLLYVRGESPCVVIHDRWQCASPPREIAFVLMTSVGNRIEAASDAGGWILRGANRRAACTIRFSAPAVVLEQDVPGRGVRRLQFMIAHPGQELLTVLAATRAGDVPAKITFVDDRELVVQTSRLAERRVKMGRDRLEWEILP